MCVYLCLRLKLFTPYLNCASVFQWFLGSRPSHCSLISAMAAFRRAVDAVSTPTSRRPLGGVQSDSITYTNKNINKSSRVPSTMFQIYMRWTIQQNKWSVPLLHTHLVLSFAFLSVFITAWTTHELSTQFILAEYVTFKAMQYAF